MCTAPYSCLVLLDMVVAFLVAEGDQTIGQDVLRWTLFLLITNVTKEVGNCFCKEMRTIQ